MCGTEGYFPEEKGGQEELLQLPSQYFPYFRFKIACPRICLQPADTSQLLAVNATTLLVFATYSCWACGFPFSALVSCQLPGGLLRLHVHSLSLCLLSLDYAPRVAITTLVLGTGMGCLA